MDNIPLPPMPVQPGLYPLDEAKKLLIIQADAEIMERENALVILRNQQFEPLHEDEPAASWIKYVPIVNLIVLIILIVIILAVVVPKLG